MNLKNLTNEYQREMGDLFDEIPKSVLAAIAVSALTCGGDQISTARARLAKEWEVLNLNGIVQQKPSKAGRAALTKDQSHD